MIAIIDYGMGNIHSVQKALEALGSRTIITHNPQDIRGCAKVVLPGVGAFTDAIAELRKRGLVAALSEHIRKKGIFLGICLGMQLLFAGSQEAGGTRGLCLLKGRVKKFPRTNSLKVPHIGWNQLKIKARGCPLLKNIADNSYVYFCHSYYPQPEAPGIIAATASYGRDFPAVVWQDNIYGVQFHPEKSQSTGLSILKNFVGF